MLARSRGCGRRHLCPESGEGVRRANDGTESVLTTQCMVRRCVAVRTFDFESGNGTTLPIRAVVVLAAGSRSNL
jgi:hypothetical protein